MKNLWNDKGIQAAFAKRSEMSTKGYHIPDSTQYFLDALDRITVPDYIPSNEDVLRCRVKTVSVVEHEFLYNGTYLRMVDVGGQRNERRKWLHMFGDVTAIIFIVALSEYDLCLREDVNKNRMHDSLEIFGKICEYKILKDTCIILFFNKEDEFAEKIQRINPVTCFPEYTGGCNYKLALEHIQGKFKDVYTKATINVNGNRSLYVFLTTATSTQLMDSVMKGVRDIILQKVLRTLAPAVYA